MLVPWVSDFVAYPLRSDVRGKLQLSGRPERHAFVVHAGFGSAEFDVPYLLMRDSPMVPTIEPELPPEITDVWIVSMCSTGHGFAWSRSSGWRLFDKAFGDEGVDAGSLEEPLGYRVDPSGPFIRA
jgi:hypothetical protein